MDTLLDQAIDTRTPYPTLAPLPGYVFQVYSIDENSNPVLEYSRSAGKVRLFTGTGLSSEPVSPDVTSRFFIASATKAVTSLAILRAIQIEEQRGESDILNLNTTTSILNCGGISSEANQITLSQALQQISGLSKVDDSCIRQRWSSSASASPSALQQCACQILKNDFNSADTGSFAYGANNFTVAGAIAEKALQRSSLTDSSNQPYTYYSWFQKVLKDVGIPSSDAFYNVTANGDLDNDLAGGLVISVPSYARLFTALNESSYLAGRIGSLQFISSTLQDAFVQPYSDDVTPVFSPYSLLIQQPSQTTDLNFRYGLGNWSECMRSWSEQSAWPKGNYSFIRPDYENCQKRINHSLGKYGFFPWISTTPGKPSYIAVLGTYDSDGVTAGSLVGQDSLDTQLMLDPVLNGIFDGGKPSPAPSPTPEQTPVATGTTCSYSGQGYLDSGVDSNLPPSSSYGMNNGAACQAACGARGAASWYVYQGYSCHCGTGSATYDSTKANSGYIGGNCTGMTAPLISCPSGQTSYNGSCYSDQISCNSISNAGGVQYFDSSSGTYGVCQFLQCDSGFHNEGSASTPACVANSRSCSVPNGTGSQSWSGSSWSTCLATLCQSGYSLSGGSCIAIPLPSPSPVSQPTPTPSASPSQAAPSPSPSPSPSPAQSPQAVSQPAVTTPDSLPISATQVAAAYSAVLRTSPPGGTTGDYLSSIVSQINSGSMTLSSYVSSLISQEQTMYTTLPALVTINAFYNATPSDSNLTTIATATSGTSYTTALELHALGYSDANVWTILAANWGADPSSSFYKLYSSLATGNNNDYTTFINLVYQAEFGKAPTAANLQNLLNDIPGLSDLLSGPGNPATPIQIMSGLYGYLLYTGQTNDIGAFADPAVYFLSNVAIDEAYWPGSSASWYGPALSNTTASTGTTLQCQDPGTNFCVHNLMPSWSQSDPSLLSYVRSNGYPTVQSDPGWCDGVSSAMVLKTIEKEVQSYASPLSKDLASFYENADSAMGNNMYILDLSQRPKIPFEQSKDQYSYIFDTMNLVNTNIQYGATQPSSVYAGVSTVTTLPSVQIDNTPGLKAVANPSFYDSSRYAANGMPLAVFAIMGRDGLGGHAIALNGTDGQYFKIYDPWGSVYNVQYEAKGGTYSSGTISVSLGSRLILDGNSYGFISSEGRTENSNGQTVDFGLINSVVWIKNYVQTSYGPTLHHQ